MRRSFGFHARSNALVSTLLLGAVTLCGCGEAESPTTVFGRQVLARELAGGLRTLLHTSAEAEKRAVMAESEQASSEFAKEAGQSSDLIDARSTELETLLKTLGYTPEQAMLAEFRKIYAESRAVDRSLLELAVEHTNLKAHRLSHGDAAKADADFQHALEEIVTSTPEDGRGEVEALSLRAQLAVERIRVLEAPHILEPEDEPMTALEARMDGLAKDARLHLDLLERRASGAPEETVAKAREALERFLRIHAEVVTLSRRNTNVRSLAISLGRKRTLTAAGDEALATLLDALESRRFRATR